MTRRRANPKTTNRKTPNSCQEANTGADYSDEEREFLAAIARYKRENRRPFPTWAEALAVAKSLGYRKVAGEQPGATGPGCASRGHEGGARGSRRQ